MHITTGVHSQVLDHARWPAIVWPLPSAKVSWDSHNWYNEPTGFSLCWYRERPEALSKTLCVFLVSPWNQNSAGQTQYVADPLFPLDLHGVDSACVYRKHLHCIRITSSKHTADCYKSPQLTLNVQTQSYNVLLSIVCLPCALVLLTTAVRKWLIEVST